MFHVCTYMLRVGLVAVPLSIRQRQAYCRPLPTHAHTAISSLAPPHTPRLPPPRFPWLRLWLVKVVKLNVNSQRSTRQQRLTRATKRERHCSAQIYWERTCSLENVMSAEPRQLHFDMKSCFYHEAIKTFGTNSGSKIEVRRIWGRFGGVSDYLGRF